jgi:3-oxoacyl-[acyl-carrier-protein] synthase III
MRNSYYSIISSSGSFIPPVKVGNEAFLQNEFYSSSGIKSENNINESINKFREITGILERCYATKDISASDLAFFAATNALESGGIDKETIDIIIVAHNFADVKSDQARIDTMPSLASRIKHKLRIKNPGTIAYDIIFGCPGWLQGVIQADYYIKSGDAKRVLVIGTDTLSRVCDPSDRDSMIFSDGAGAVILDQTESPYPVGILSHSSRSDTLDECFFLKMGTSNNPALNDGSLYIKMKGRRLYQYALKNVPGVVSECLRKAGVSLENVKKILLHQANAKMDEAILKEVFALFGAGKIPPEILPMTIARLGNNSVATLPVLYDYIFKKILKNHEFNMGDNIVFASVGAGMNINSIVYRIP